MPKFRVSLQVFSSISFVVEANSPEKAKEIASEASEPGLCYQCQRQAGYEEDYMEEVEFSVDSIGKVVNVELEE